MSKPILIGVCTRCWFKPCECPLQVGDRVRITNLHGGEEPFPEHTQGRFATLIKIDPPDGEMSHLFRFEQDPGPGCPDTWWSHPGNVERVL